MRKLVALLPALALLAGCPSFSTMGTARTIPKGETKFHVGVGGMQLRGWSTDDTTGELETLTIPQFELGVSHAVSDSAEVGGKIWFLGAEINSKFQLVRAPTDGGGLDIAIAPAISFYPLSGENNANETTTGGLVYTHLPVLFGLNVGGSQLVIGPRLSNTLVWGSAGSSSTTGSIFWAGGSLGFAIKLGDTFRILPEISVAYPFAASSGTKTTLDLPFEGAIVQGQLGLVFGK